MTGPQGLGKQTWLVLPALLHRLPDLFLVLLPILFEQICGLDVRRRAGIRVIQQTLDTRQDRRDIVRRTPSILEDVKAELACGVDVWMEHGADESDLWRFVGIVWAEVEG